MYTTTCYLHTQEGKTPVYAAITNDKLEVVKYLHEVAKANVNTANWVGLLAGTADRLTDTVRQTGRQTDRDRQADR